jgi:hypothetical protein
VNKEELIVTLDCVYKWERLEDRSRDRVYWVYRKRDRVMRYTKVAQIERRSHKNRQYGKSIVWAYTAYVDLSETAQANDAPAYLDGAKLAGGPLTQHTLRDAKRVAEEWITSHPITPIIEEPAMAKKTVAKKATAKKGRTPTKTCIDKKCGASMHAKCGTCPTCGKVQPKKEKPVVTVAASTTPAKTDLGRSGFRGNKTTTETWDGLNDLLAVVKKYGIDATEAAFDVIKEIKGL